MLPVRLSRPVNRQHRLAQAMQAWWRYVPGLAGGPRWFDLLGRNHLSFVGMPSTHGWGRSLIRPGGDGDLNFDGSTCGAQATLDMSAFNKMTVAGWFLLRNTTESIVLETTANYNSSTGGILFDHGFNAGTQVILAIKGGGNTNAMVFTLPSRDVWHHYLFTVDFTVSGTGIRFPTVLLDGVSPAGLTQNFTGDVGTGTFPNSTINLGQRYTNVAPANMACDDVAVWGRHLSAAEIQEWYRSTRDGHPGLLNRIERPRSTLLFAPAVTDFTALVNATIAPVTAAAGAAFTSPEYTASVNATIGGVTAEATAESVSPNKLITVAATIGAVTAAAGGVSIGSSFTASVAALAGAVTAAVSGSYAAGGTKTASVAAAIAPATAAAALAVTPPVVTAAVAATIGAVTAEAAAEVAAPVSSATVAAQIGPVYAAASAAADESLNTATVAATIAPVEAATAATYTPADYAAAVAATIAPVTAQAMATFTENAFNATVNATIGAIVAAVSATDTDPDNVAAVAATIAPITAEVHLKFRQAAGRLLSLRRRSVLW
ncbi:MAG: hypothetical protein A3E01_10735 [Gammaproteobacteria bacterium RIFCSPHIGHO2_12_FULL_63_22]|nr:MAG: hypothetical protein A3E01_10735 [Gammaproteobacteria bacterium RIFCSPHIGHO2_12_FULL_63_22]